MATSRLKSEHRSGTMIERVKVAEEEEASFLRPDFHLFMCSRKIEGCVSG